MTAEQLRIVQAQTVFPEIKAAPRPQKPELKFHSREIDGQFYVLLSWQDAWKLRKYLDAVELNINKNEGRIILLNKQVKQLHQLR